MSLEKLQTIDASEIPLGKLFSVIFRSYLSYFNNHTKDININGAQIFYLLEIYKKNEINQDEIALQCKTDKGAIARALKKMEDNDLIIRKIDENNRRQNKVSLTEAGKNTAITLMKVLQNWENEIYDSIDYDKNELHELLKQIAIKAIDLNKK